MSFATTAPLTQTLTSYWGKKMEIKRDPNGDIHIHITNINNNTNSNVNDIANTNENLEDSETEEKSHAIRDLLEGAAILAATGLVSFLF